MMWLVLSVWMVAATGLGVLVGRILGRSRRMYVERPERIGASLPWGWDTGHLESLQQDTRSQQP